MRHVLCLACSRKGKTASLAELSAEGPSMETKPGGGKDRHVFGPGQRLWILFWVDGITGFEPEGNTG